MKLELKDFVNQYKVGSMKRKKKGAYFILEIAFFLIFVAIITAVATGMLGNTDGAKVATTNQELDQIRTAVLNYRTYRIDGANPTLGDLVVSPSISKENAIDGRQHDAFLQTSPRWSSSGLKDMWGNDYVIDTSANTVYSTAGSSDSSDYITLSLGTTSGT